MKLLVITALTLSSLFAASSAGEGFCEYTYTDTDHGLDKWGEACHSPSCSTGRSQSPVDLSHADIKPPFTKGVTFHDYSHRVGFDVSHTWGLTKNHVLSIALPKNGTHPTISGGPLGDNVYQLLQFHFHWGSNRFSGSEHSVERRAFPGELHFVHMLQEFGDDVARALEGEPSRQTLAVVAFFLDVTEESKYEDNVDLEAFLNLMRHHAGLIQGTNVDPAPDQHVESVDFSKHEANIDLLLPPKFPTSPFYHYNGSLTTPPCAEVVSWIVMEETIKISIEQLQKFFHDGNFFDDFNHRPTQKLNGRKVYYFKPPEEEDPDRFFVKDIGADKWKIRDQINQNEGVTKGVMDGGECICPQRLTNATQTVDVNIVAIFFTFFFATLLNYC